MSLSPEPLPPSILRSETPEASQTSVLEPPVSTFRIFLNFAFSLLALAVGAALMVMPWLDNWSFNYFQGWNRTMSEMWDEPLFRAGISALGLLNLSIAVRAAFRLGRSSAS
jgi:hypothetical protein